MSHRCCHAKEAATPSSSSDEARLMQLQEELAQLKSELEHAHRLATIGTIAAGIAHEINNILTPVLAYAQLASANPNDASLQAKALDRTINGVQTATQVAQAMLGFSATVDQPDFADVKTTVQAALDCLGFDHRMDRVRINVSVADGVGVQMRPIALQQVLMNLLLNATAALPPKGGQITVSALPRSDGTTAIEVHDTGPGIPPEIAGRLFEPFVHRAAVAPPTVAGRISGKKVPSTGLGLAICRRIIDDASGTIVATSDAKSGTLFTIVVPSASRARSKTG